jgi:hypothetical protein
MTTAAPSTALATIQPLFTEAERLALAGFLAGYRGLTREAYALGLRQFALDLSGLVLDMTFADENGRQAHLNGPIAAALGQAGPGLLAKEPEIQRTDILAAK